MVSPSRCASVALLLTGVEAARVSRKRAAESSPNTKFIAGVPVLNYHRAYDGVPSLAEGEHEGREGDWVVMLTDEASDAQIQQACKAARNGCKLAGHQGGVPFVEFLGTESDLEVVINAAQGAVKYVEPDSNVQMIPEVGLRESAEPEASTWGLNRIGFDQRPRSGGSVTVYVLDTGIRITHKVFEGRAEPVLDVSKRTGPIECGKDLSCAPDYNGHGTHCAGTAVGWAVGVAPAAAVRSMKVLDDRGYGQFSWSYKAIDWVAKSRTRPAVVSMSLGGKGNNWAMADTIDGAVNSGVVVVVAGGNDNADACSFSPAFVPSAITVGSVTSEDERSAFSNYGTCTNIWAPGSEVISSHHFDDIGYRIMSGTSMACPHVAGAAALVLEANPSMKPSAVLSELLDNSVRNALTGLKGGDTNALLYVGAGGPPPTPEPVPTPPPPTPAPCDEATSRGPDSDGDCRCNNGLSCIAYGPMGPKPGCPYSQTPTLNKLSDRYYLPSCSVCKCE